jgi:hexosaminidase
MKKLFVIPFLFIIFTASGQTEKVSIIPQPAELQTGTGSFRLKARTTITCDSPEGKEVSEMLAMKLNQATGFIIKLKEGKKGSIQLNINEEVNSRLGAEGYSLSITSKNIIISANKPAGLFYGMQSLLQIILPDYQRVPVINITDYPRFAWRGIMLDVSRNFFSKEEVEKYIDEIAKFKFNIFHWHLTDDNGWRIEIKSLPKLTEVGAWRVARAGHFGDRDNPKPGEAATVGGFYTQEDIREIVKYAQARFITIVPEIDVPGHSMAAIASYPELCCTKNPDIRVNPGTSFSEWYADGTFKMLIDNTLNPSDDKVYKFLDKVFSEVAQLFPGQYIHVGGDECYNGYWEADTGCLALMKKLGLTKAGQLQGYFVNRVEKILQSKGKKLISWDETLEGGISPDVAVMSWRGMQGGIDAAKLGHYVVMTPAPFVYLDFQQGEKTIEPPIYASLRLQKCYSFNPVPEGVDAKYILGGQGNLWTEQIPEFRYAEYMTWPRGWALAEDFWTPFEKKNWSDFIIRVERQFLRNDIEGINYSKAVYDPIISTIKADGKTMAEMSTEAPGLKIYYTIDDQMPDSFSPEYTKPFEIPAGGPVTLRVIAYRDGKPVGHLITLKPEDLKNR